MIIDYLKNTITELRDDFKDADTTGAVAWYMSRKK